MRQVTHFCVTFASLLRPKRRRHRRFSGALAQNQWLNRRPDQPDRGELSLQRPSVTGSEPIIRRPGTSASKIEAPSVPTAGPSCRLPRPTANPSQPLAPPASPCRPAIRGDGFPRSHGPAEDIVKHQMVNVRLTLVRVTAAGAEGKIQWNFRREPGAARKGRPMADATGWRIFASLCVPLGTETTRKSPLFEPFLAQNRWLNRRPGQADRVGLSPQGRASPVRRQSSAEVVQHYRRRPAPFPPVFSSPL